jgi:lactoylglutathione lyase
MAKPVHSMIRVLDEAKSLDFYARAFGLEVADHLKFADFALIYLRHPSSPFEVELTVNFGRKEPYAPGDGYGHLAVVVDDVEAGPWAAARFQARGLDIGALFLRRRPRRVQDRSDPEGRALRLIAINKHSNGGHP